MRSFPVPAASSIFGINKLSRGPYTCHLWSFERRGVSGDNLRRVALPTDGCTARPPSIFNGHGDETARGLVAPDEVQLTQPSARPSMPQ
jgi:hypothetical protein